MWPTVRTTRLEARQPLENSCAILITSTFITTITHVLPSATTFERYITDSQADKTTTITQTILEAIQRTITSQLPVVTIFCAPSPSLITNSFIPIGKDKSTSLSYASSFLPSPTFNNTAPTATPIPDPISPSAPSKVPAIIAAATIPIVVFVVVMWTFCFFRLRAQKKKVVDLENIAIEPQTSTQPKFTLPPSTTLGTTIVGEYIPEDSISFVQHTNPSNPVDHSLESIVESSETQQVFNKQPVSALYRQSAAFNPLLEDIHYNPSASHHNISNASGAPRTSDDIYQPVPSSLFSLAIKQLTEMTDQHLTNPSALTAAVKHNAEMANPQLPVSCLGPACRQKPGGCDEELTTVAAEATSQGFTAQETRGAQEERQRLGQRQMRFYGLLPQNAQIIRGTGNSRRLDTHGRLPPTDNLVAIQVAALRRERTVEQQRELQKLIVEGVGYRQGGTEEIREKIRGEGVTNTQLTDFDVDAVNRRTANQPPRPRLRNS